LKTHILKITASILFLFLVTGSLTACSAKPDRETVTQYSTIDSLLNGLYDGITTVGQLKKYGDIGIGTFEGLDGEMLELDGQFYQVKFDGKASLVDQTVKSPFAVVTFFDTDLKETLPFGLDNAGLQSYLDSKLPTANIFYAFKISGRFSYMKTRSVPAQVKPYPKLVDVTKNQAVFEFKDLEGTMVGFRCPPYVNGVNLPGYHLHFLNATKDAGGHVLDFKVSQAEAKVDFTSQFNLVLPDQGSDFYKFDFSVDQSTDIQKAEK
jgi:acetolactate decarboxylase